MMKRSRSANLVVVVVVIDVRQATRLQCRHSRFVINPELPVYRNHGQIFSQNSEKRYIKISAVV